MITKKKWMCYEDKEYLDPSFYKEQYENNNGDKVKVTRFRDGSSTYHFGGPCGSTNYNDLGEEC